MNTLNFAKEPHNINGHGHTQMHTDIQSEHTSSKYREAMTPFYPSKPAQLNSVGLFNRGRSTKNVCVGLCVSVANKIKKMATDPHRLTRTFFLRSAGRKIETRLMSGNSGKKNGRIIFYHEFYHEVMTVFILSTAAGRA